MVIIILAMIQRAKWETEASCRELVVFKPGLRPSIANQEYELIGDRFRGRVFLNSGSESRCSVLIFLRGR